MKTTREPFRVFCITGKGRTAFKRPLTKINDTTWLVGADTLKMRYPTAWIQGGNVFGTTGILGTLDSNNLDIYTNSIRRGRWMSNGNLHLGTNTDNGAALQVSGRVYSGQQLQAGNFIPGGTPAASGATIIT